MNDDRKNRPTNLASALDARSIERVEIAADEARDALSTLARRADLRSAKRRAAARRFSKLDRDHDRQLSPAIGRVRDDLARAADVLAQLANQARTHAATLDDPESERARAYWRATSIGFESRDAWRAYALAQLIEQSVESPTGYAIAALDATARFESSAIRFAAETLDRLGESGRASLSTTLDSGSIDSGSIAFELATTAAIATAPRAELLRAWLADSTIEQRVGRQLSNHLNGFAIGRAAAIEALAADRGRVAIGIALDAIPIGAGDQRARGSSARAALSMLLDEGIDR